MLNFATSATGADEGRSHLKKADGLAQTKSETFVCVAWGIFCILLSTKPY